MQRGYTHGPLGRRGSCPSSSAEGATFWRTMLAWEGGETERDSAVSGKGRGWCLALLDPRLPDTSFERGLLMEVTQKVQRSPMIVPVGPRQCRNSDPMCDALFDVYNLEQERWLRWVICQLQHPMRAAEKSSASWRDRAGQPSSVPQCCCLLGRTVQRSLSARVGPKLSSSTVWFAQTHVDLCVHPLAAGSAYVLCCYGLREQSWPL